MTIGVFHKWFLLLQTDNETYAWEKAQQYRDWFSGIEVRSIGQEPSTRKQRNGARNTR